MAQKPKEDPSRLEVDPNDHIRMHDIASSITPDTNPRHSGSTPWRVVDQSGGHTGRDLRRFRDFLQSVGAWNFSLKSSFIEICNEDLDLLADERSANGRREVQIREDKHS